MSRSYWAEPRRLCPRRLTGCGKTREPGLRQPGSSRCASCEGSFPWFTNVRGTPSSGAAGEPKDDSNQTWKVIRASRVAAERPSSLVRSSRPAVRALRSASSHRRDEKLGGVGGANPLDARFKPRADYHGTPRAPTRGGHCQSGVGVRVTKRHDSPFNESQQPCQATRLSPSSVFPDCVGLLGNH